MFYWYFLTETNKISKQLSKRVDSKKDNILRERVTHPIGHHTEVIIYLWPPLLLPLSSPLLAAPPLLTPVIARGCNDASAVKPNQRPSIF
jgi:hypothetical protein